MAKFDYDLITIGAGSGGVRASRLAGAYGARVAIIEELREGGTCVLRGCVPKKLLVYGSHVAEELSDAEGYGWKFDGTNHNWARMIEAKNNADSLVYSTEKSLGEYGEQIDTTDKEAIEKDIASLKEAIEAEDLEAITKGTEALSQSSMKLGEAMYKASQEEAAAGGEDGDGESSSGEKEDKSDDVVDADFEEVDDEKEKKTGS